MSKQAPADQRARLRAFLAGDTRDDIPRRAMRRRDSFLYELFRRPRTVVDAHSITVPRRGRRPQATWGRDEVAFVANVTLSLRWWQKYPVAETWIVGVDGQPLDAVPWSYSSDCEARDTGLPLRKYGPFVPRGVARTVLP